MSISKAKYHEFRNRALSSEVDARYRLGGIHAEAEGIKRVTAMAVNWMMPANSARQGGGFKFRFTWPREIGITPMRLPLLPIAFAPHSSLSPMHDAPIHPTLVEEDDVSAKEIRQAFWKAGSSNVLHHALDCLVELP
jgi:hypothetical protein